MDTWVWIVIAVAVVVVAAIVLLAVRRAHRCAGRTSGETRRASFGDKQSQRQEAALTARRANELDPDVDLEEEWRTGT